MVFSRYIEIGRLCLVKEGANTGKTVVVLDVIDGTRLLVANPSAGIARTQINLKHVSPTDFTVKISRGARTAQLTKALQESGAEEKFAASSWGRKLAAKSARANLSDFERFKVMLLQKKRSAIVKRAVKKN